jgi:hypothetical protein
MVQTKGWKGPNDALTSYANLEKLIGTPAERVLKLPEKSDAPEWSQIYDRLGRPSKPEEYKLPVPEGQSDAFAKEVAPVLHEAGLSRTQAEKLATWWNAKQAGVAAEQQQAQQAAAAADADKLKGDWGAAYDQNLQTAKSAAAQFGVSAEQVNALESVMGFKGTIEFFHKIGSKIGEAGFVSGEAGGGMGALTPEQAKHEISQLRSDTDWAKRYIGGDKEARDQMERLQKFAAPGMQAA